MSTTSDGEGFSNSDMLKELVKLIPRYDGAHDINKLLDFIDNFDDFARPSNLPEKTLLSLASAKLAGDAKLWWREHQTLHSDDGDDPKRINTWTALKGELIQTFSPPGHTTTIRSKLRNIKQTGSVSEYNAAFRRLTMQLIDLSSAEAKYEYLRGLKPRIRELAQSRDDIDDIRKLQLLCLRLDAYQDKGSREDEALFVAGGNSASTTSSTTSGMSGNFKKGSGKGPRKGKGKENCGDGIRKNKGNSNRGDGDKMCFLCREKGHYVNKCPKMEKAREALSLTNSEALFVEVPSKKSGPAKLTLEKSALKRSGPDKLVVQGSDIKKSTSEKSNVKKSVKKSAPVMLSGASAISANFAESVGGPKPIIIDSGATQHMFNDFDLFGVAHPKETRITCANSKDLLSTHVGDVVCGEKRFSDVLYVPKLRANLLSVRALTEEGDVIFRKNGMVELSKNGENIRIGQIFGNTYQLTNTAFTVTTRAVNMPVTSIPNAPTATTKNDDKFNLWHHRLGHPNRQVLLSMPDHVKGMDSLSRSSSKLCEPCQYAKSHRQKFPKNATNRANAILGRVHSDLCGPLPTSVGGAKYILTLIDDHTRYTHVYFLANKSDAFGKFQVFKNLVEKQTGKSIKIFRSDGGGEYINTDFKDFFAKNGIRHETTVAETPQQNGVAE